MTEYWRLLSCKGPNTDVYCLRKGPNTDICCLVKDRILTSCVLQRTEYWCLLSCKGQNTDVYCLAKDRILTSTVLRHANPHLYKRHADPHLYKRQANPHLYKRHTNPHLYKRHADPHLYQRQANPHLYKRQANPHLYKRQANPHLYKRPANLHLYKRQAKCTHCPTFYFINNATDHRSRTVRYEGLQLYHWLELPQVSFVCRNKTRLLSRQKYTCSGKTFVATKYFWGTNTCLSRQKLYLWQVLPVIQQRHSPAIIEQWRCDWCRLLEADLGSASFLLGQWDEIRRCMMRLTSAYILLCSGMHLFRRWRSGC